VIVSYTKFRSLFELPDKIDYEEFKSKIKVKRNQKIMDYTPDEFFEARNDFRLVQKEQYYRNLYEICVTDRETTLEMWFNSHIKIDNLSKHMNFSLSDNILKDGVIHGRLQNKGRIVKNINFDKIFATKKYSSEDNMPILNELKCMFTDYIINSNLIIPHGFKKVISKDLSTIFAIMRGTRHRASIFNPYTYGWLLQNYFEGERVIAPTAGWNAYQIGFHQTDWKEFTCIDVIESVIENVSDIADYYNTNPFTENKIVSGHCCPSEKVLLEEKNYYDLSLCSPPYFNLEIYETDNQNQSVNNFPEYNDWLEGYWNATVENILPTLKSGGTFAFVISNYKDVFSNVKKENSNDSQINISEDMLNICKRHMTYEKTENIAWSGFSTLAGKMGTKGNVEDMHILSKKF
jgi:hypothetical protein|tara:strand:+ start:677 stop:1891 length:1215 start_codon:yes stop_codon:yes gene_type:complete